jgi:hypothetical protein
MRLLFLFLFLGLNVFSQRILIDDIGSLKNFSADSIQKELLLFYDGYYDKYDLRTFKKEKVEFHTPPEFNVERYIFLAVDSLQFFISRDGGMVYQFKKDTVIRIDNSFGHRMQAGSNLFSYDSKIYRYGGYGFWSVRNFFIYYDHKTHEWEVNDRVNSEEIPDGTYSSNFILDHDEIYLFGGLKINPYKQLERIKNDEVWKYNFKDHKWKFLGFNQILPEGKTIKYGKKILHVSTNHISEIDVIHNKISLYGHNLISPKLHKTFKSFFLDHRFYCFIAKRGKVSLKIMNEKDFLREKKSEAAFYKNTSYWLDRSLLIILIIVLILITGWFLWNYYKKRNKVLLLDNGVRYKNKFIEFDKESMQIIRGLLTEKEMSSVNILNIVEKEQYSPAHNERIKVQKLNDINLKIKALLGINEDVIRSVKSKFDKRIKIYIISSEYFAVKRKPKVRG